MEEACSKPKMTSLARKVIIDKEMESFPLSQSVSVDRFVFLSGCIGTKPGGRVLEEGIENQTRATLANMAIALKAAGSSLEQVVKTTVFLQNYDHFSQVNEVYREGDIFDILLCFDIVSFCIPVFKKDFPARSCFQVAKLPMNALIEIECIALNGKVKTTSSKL